MGQSTYRVLGKRKDWASHMKVLQSMREFVTHRYGRTAKRIGREKVGCAFLLLFLLCVLTTSLAQQIAPYDPYQIDLRAVLRSPSREHVLGTDVFGRDLLSRTLLAGQVSLRLCMSSLAIALVLGVPIGLMAGFSGGRSDWIIMRVTDMLLAFPSILLAILVVTVVGSGEQSVMLALSFYAVPQFIRIARGSTIDIRGETYIEASRAMGAPSWRIVCRHIWPNISTPVIVQATLMLPALVLTAASLSYLGLGVQPPTPEWGAMLNRAKDYLRVAPHLLIGPGVGLFIFVMSANITGDVLQHVFNPKYER